MAYFSLTKTNNNTIYLWGHSSNVHIHIHTHRTEMFGVYAGDGDGDGNGWCCCFCATRWEASFYSINNQIELCSNTLLLLLLFSFCYGRMSIIYGSCTCPCMCERLNHTNVYMAHIASSAKWSKMKTYEFYKNRNETKTEKSTLGAGAWWRQAAHEIHI